MELDLLLCCAGGADVLVPFPLHLPALCLADTNTVAMEPLLAAVTADHEPGNKAASDQEVKLTDGLGMQKTPDALRDLVTRNVPFILFLSTDAVQSTGVRAICVRYA